MSRPARDSGKYANEHSRLAYNAMLAVSHMKIDQWPTEILSVKDGGDRYLDWTCSPAGLRSIAEKIRSGELALVPTQKNGSEPGDKPIGVCVHCGLTVVRRFDGRRAHIGWNHPEQTWHDSLTEDEQVREMRAKMQRLEDKEKEVADRQSVAKALPSDGVVHSLKAPTKEGKKPRWWRRTE